MIPFAVRFILIAIAALSAVRPGSWAVQDSQPATRTARDPGTPAANSRDRYSSARPLTFERFRRVFTGFDTDGNGILTNKEAKAAGQTESQFQRFDADRNGTVTLDEFEWIYGNDLRERGQLFDATLLKYFEKLNDRALASRWNIRGAEPAGGSRNRIGYIKTESSPAPKKTGATESRPAKKYR
ncbi:MAG: EF-hand domain-containing protein [Planctomycetota bacterium]